MQVIGDLVKQPSLSGKLFKGKVKQIAVICFKVDLPSWCQELAIHGKEAAMGKAPFIMAALGPGITKVDIKPIYFLSGKNLQHMIDIKDNEPHIVKFSSSDFLRGEEDVNASAAGRWACAGWLAERCGW